MLQDRGQEDHVIQSYFKNARLIFSPFCSMRSKQFYLAGPLICQHGAGARSQEDRNKFGFRPCVFLKLNTMMCSVVVGFQIFCFRVDEN
jgi:hypothetical protein